MTKRRVAVVCASLLLPVIASSVNFAQIARVQSFAAPALMTAAAQNAMVKDYCLGCHNTRTKSGGLSLEGLDLAKITEHSEVAEKMIRKLRASMMPPPGAKRPDGAVIKALAAAMETNIDRAAALKPNPGNRALQRLNRVEYANSVRDLLKVEVDVAAILPPDSMNRGFDNIADVLAMSPALMEGYVRAAAKISRAAIGDVKAAPSVVTFNVPRTASQMRHVDGAPFGTRGGISIVHNFPADGEYTFRLDLFDDSNGLLVGMKSENEQIELSINGERAALMDIDNKMSVTKAGVFVQTPRLRVKAGPQRVSAAFIEKSAGPVDDLIAPIEQTLADTEQSTAYGITILPHLKTMGIGGPFNPTGTSETPSRAKVFSCRPTTSAAEATCASEIIRKLASEAYRRPVSSEDLEGLLNFYRMGREKGDFETGIRNAIEAVLANPSFVFRFEREPSGPTVKPGQAYRISDTELASRLSYFLWSTSPDSELLNLASQKKLRDPLVLTAQVKRMLASPKSESLATRFASQWLHLSDLDVMNPDPLLYPQFDTTLSRAMHRETELFFDSIVREDRNVLDLLTADYTFVNEVLAKHYKMPDIDGNRFRRVTITQPYRRGLLGQGSILTLTSIADRTSPVARGKFVMEVLLGTPPPPPPPSVPALEETKAARGEKLLTLRERMEEHRANATCAGCHKLMDPIGMAMENFDVTGRWRDLDAGNLIDTAGVLFDGTKLDGPASLRQALVAHSDSFISNFTQILMMYGLGRRVEYFDMPTIRTIVKSAARNNNRFSAFVEGIVNSSQFQMRAVQPTTDNQK